MAFIITQISAYNYSGDNHKLSGTIHLKEERSETKMEVKLTSEDAARIFEIFADRLSATVQLAAQTVLDEVRTVETPVIEPPAPPVDDEIPF